MDTIEAQPGAITDKQLRNIPVKTLSTGAIQSDSVEAT
jgi:hypothetical protein